MVTLDFIRDIQIYQHKNGYRFSVDALLLATFVGMVRVSRIADLCAGSGVIGLLLARRYPSQRSCWWSSRSLSRSWPGETLT